MKAEYQGNEGFLQRDSVEHKGYAEAHSTDRREGKERGGAEDLMNAILERDNLNKAYKQVKRNHGAAGIAGMSVEEALSWLKEHQEELLQSIRDGSYVPKLVRRKEIPKVDGGVRKLGIPADKAYQWGNSRLGYWRIAGSPVLECSTTNKRLAAVGYFSILDYYESLHLCG